MECLEMPVFDEFFILKPESYDGSFVQSLDVLPIIDTSIADEAPGDYANSAFSISDPPLSEQQQIEQNSVLASGQSPDNPLNTQRAGFVEGFVGGQAGGVDVGTGANGSPEWTEKINISDT